jgi:hypothetical protein
VDPRTPSEMPSHAVAAPQLPPTPATALSLAFTRQQQQGFRTDSAPGTQHPRVRAPRVHKSHTQRCRRRVSFGLRFRHPTGREGVGLTHPAGPSRSNLAAALALHSSRWLWRCRQAARAHAGALGRHRRTARGHCGGACAAAADTADTPGATAASASARYSRPLLEEARSLDVELSAARTPQR